jgi:hypothetical protein
MKRMDEALEAAYEAHIMSLYEVLTQSLLTANGNEAEIGAAQERFKHGLGFAAEVRARARMAAGL